MTRLTTLGNHVYVWYRWCEQYQMAMVMIGLSLIFLSPINYEMKRKVEETLRRKKNPFS